MNPTHEINWKRCNLEKNVFRQLQKVDESFFLQFTNCNKVKPSTITVNW